MILMMGLFEHHGILLLLALSFICVCWRGGVGGRLGFLLLLLLSSFSSSLLGDAKDVNITITTTAGSARNWEREKWEGFFDDEKIGWGIFDDGARGACLLAFVGCVCVCSGVERWLWFWVVWWVG